MKCMFNITRGLYSLPILLFFFSLNSFAQVGIGNTDPSSASLLDIGDGTHDNTKGILIPRVSLESLTTLSPITPATGAEESLLVYNTNASIGKGFYYWNGDTRWVRIMASDAPIDKWSLTGNEATNSDFLGTTNNQSLRIRTNDTERMRVLADGKVVINGTSPITDTRLTVSESDANRAVFGSTGSGEGIRGEASSGLGVMGLTETGVGVRGASLGNGYGGVFSGNNTNAVGALIAGGNQPLLEFSDTGTGASITGSSFGVTGFGRSTDSGVGVVGIGDGLSSLPIGRPSAVGVIGYGWQAGVFGQSGYDNNYGVHGKSLSGGAGVYGEVDSEGIGVSGNAPTGTGVQGVSDSGDGVVGLTNGTGVASGVFGWSYNEAYGGWFSSSTSTNSTGTGTGLVATMGLAAITLPNGSGVAANGVKTGIYASASASGSGSTNSGNAAGEFNLGSHPSGGTNTIRASAKIAGYHQGAVPVPSGGGTGTTGSTNTNNYYGGYFAGGVGGGFSIPPAYAYVGIKHGALTNGTYGTNYKIIGNGNVSTLVDDSAGNKRILFAPEAPEILFEDYGVGKLQNGSVYIEIDPLFAKSIHVSEKHPLKVFIQLEGECNGVFVTEKTASGFLVKELNGGTSNTPFSYHIVANRADDIASDGSIASKHVGLRFPIGPGPAEMMETRVVKVKEDKVKSEKAKDKTAASTESDIQAVEKHSSSEPQLLQEQQPADTPVKSSNNNMQLQESK